MPTKKHSPRTKSDNKKPAPKSSPSRTYTMEDQVGFLIRLANQRHASIFASRIVGSLTPTQFAALNKLQDVGSCSQNELGRLAAMDAPTIKGVVERLHARELVEIVIDPNDKRRRSITLTVQGRHLVQEGREVATQISREILHPLKPGERTEFLRMLRMVGRSG